MFNRVCKVETIAEGGMRIVIADAHVIVLAWPEDGASAKPPAATVRGPHQQRR